MDKLDELRLRYWRSLPQKAQDLIERWHALQLRPDERAPIAELQQLVHKLSGSAPAYGFDAIGGLARPVDQRLGEWLRSDGIDEPSAAADLVASVAVPFGALIAALHAAADADLPPP